MSFKTKSCVKRALVPDGCQSHRSFLWDRQPVPRSAGPAGQQRQRALPRNGELEMWKEQASCEIIVSSGFAHVYKDIED